jgi:hypothetical protein
MTYLRSTACSDSEEASKAEALPTQRSVARIRIVFFCFFITADLSN